jgi:hypothetical protein
MTKKFKKNKLEVKIKILIVHLQQMIAISLHDVCLAQHSTDLQSKGLLTPIKKQISLFV